MVVVDGAEAPLGDHLHFVSLAEVRLAEIMLAAIHVSRRHRAGRPRQKPVRVIADKASEQRSAAKAVAAARHRVDLSAQTESRSSGDAGAHRPARFVVSEAADKQAR